MPYQSEKNMTQQEKINAAVDYLKKNGRHPSPTIGLILGSGLGSIAESINNPQIISYKDIPSFPMSTVEGHAGQLVFGQLEGKNVVVMQGRLHYYEGHKMDVLALPIRILKGLGVEQLVITSATGGVNEAKLKTGDLMLITDHINFVLTNPLVGQNLDEYGPRFPDTSEVYTPKLVDLAKKVAKDRNISLKEGIYLFTTGPTYETPAEVNMMKFLGTDVAGMSTFPEAVTASHCGIDVIGITYVANMATGISKEPLSHGDIMKTMEIVKDDFISLIEGIVQNM